MQIQQAGSLPVTLPESNNASLGSGYLSVPERRTMTSTDARTVRRVVATCLRCRGCVTCGSSSAAQANICCWCFTDGPARLSLHRMLGIPHCRPSSPKKKTLIYTYTQTPYTTSFRVKNLEYYFHNISSSK